MVQVRHHNMCNTHILILYTVLLWELFVVDGQTIFFPDSTNTSSTSISEGATSGTLVYTVTGTSTLTFSKVNQSPASPDFPFDGTTGELTSPAGLDTETVPEFLFTFSGTDGSTTVISGTLTVEIDDVNDNPPVFTVSSFTTTIVDTVSDGYVITTVNATDADVSYFHLFSITGGDTGSTFDIGSTTGVLTVQTASNIDVATTPTYTLTIEVSDLSSTDAMTVIINVQADPCTQNPCQNSGSCTNSGDSYTCTCTTGYIGTNCTDVDPCTPNPCQNSGSCTSSGESYTCTCTAGYIGTNCTDDDPCLPLPCLNSGTCSVDGSGYTCTCPSGWIDSTCSTDDPCLPNPCNNSGTCSVIGSGYQCACATGYSGENCTDTGTGNQDADVPSRDNTILIVSVVVTVVLLLVLVTVIMIAAKVKLSKRMSFQNSLRNGKQKPFKGFSSSRSSVVPSNETFVVISK